MSIGRRSSRKRPRNDLDDYLEDVDSRLFCVTRADRTCLLRDLKSFVRELTTDSDRGAEYSGRYQITREQLEKEIGEPGEIASRYISSVHTKVPSLGLRCFSVLMLIVFASSMAFGTDRLLWSIRFETTNELWSNLKGISFIIGGAVGFSLIILSMIRFVEYHIVLAYLILVFIVISIPMLLLLAKVLISSVYLGLAPFLNDLYFTLFLLDVVIIGIIGLYIYLRHYQVMNPRRELWF